MSEPRAAEPAKQSAAAAAGSAPPAAAAPAPAASAAAAAKQFTGYHSFMVNACKFTVDAKYQPLKPLGRGAYGVVWSVWTREHGGDVESFHRKRSHEFALCCVARDCSSANDKVSGRKVSDATERSTASLCRLIDPSMLTAASSRACSLCRFLSLQVAIKKIPKAFDDLVDAKRILREIKLLRHFKHENIVGLRDLIGPIEGEPFEDIYMILDFMETDLHKIIYSKNELTDEHIQYFIYQLLKGLKYIHSAHGE